jgi:hypothetical protein
VTGVHIYAMFLVAGAGFITTYSDGPAKLKQGIRVTILPPNDKPVADAVAGVAKREIEKTIENMELRMLISILYCK